MARTPDTKNNPMPDQPSTPLRPTVAAPSTLGQIKDVGDRRVPQPTNVDQATAAPKPPMQDVQGGGTPTGLGGAGTTAPDAAGPFKGSGGFALPK